MLVLLVFLKQFNKTNIYIYPAHIFFFLPLNVFLQNLDMRLQTDETAENLNKQHIKSVNVLSFYHCSAQSSGLYLSQQNIQHS